MCSYEWQDQPDDVDDKRLQAREAAGHVRVHAVARDLGPAPDPHVRMVSRALITIAKQQLKREREARTRKENEA